MFFSLAFYTHLHKHTVHHIHPHSAIQVDHDH